MQKLFIVAVDAIGVQVARAEFEGEWIDSDAVIAAFKKMIYPKSGVVSMKVEITFPLEEQFAAVQSQQHQMPGPDTYGLRRNGNPN